MANHDHSLIVRAPSGGRVLVVGNGAAQLIGLLAAPVLTRMYTADEFGYLTIFMSLLGLFGLVSTLRYDQAVLAADDDDTAERVLALSLVVAVLFGCAVALVMWTGRAALGARLGASRDFVGVLAVVLPLGLAGFGVFQSLMAHATRRQRFGAAAAARVIQAAAAAAVQVGGALLAGGYPVLLAGILVGQAAGVARLLKAAPGRLVERMGRDTLLPTARRFERFPRYASFATLLNSGALLLPTILLGVFYGSAVAGWFGLGQRAIGLPMFVIGGAMAQVYASRFSGARREGRAAARSLMAATVKRLLPVSALILVGSLFGPRVFEIVFGPDWRTAGEYVAVLAVPFALQILASPVSITANLMDRQDLQLLFDGVRMAAVVAALVIAPLAGVGPHGAVVVLAIVLSVTYVGYLVMNWSLLRGGEA